MEATTETTTDTTWQDAAAASATAEEKAAQLAMPPRRFDEVLPCTLTDEELRERGDELVKVLATIDQIEAEKKIANDGFKARIQIQESRARELRDAIENKREDREVECVESYELRIGVARTTRVDTGEQIRERALRSSELQPTLPAVDDRPQTDLADAIATLKDPDGTGRTKVTSVGLDGTEKQIAGPVDGPEVDEPAVGDGATEITDPSGLLGDEEPTEKPRRARRAKA